MAPPRLEIGPIKSVGGLKTCLPYLMPFHIDYSGKAPISTYLRVEAANESVGAPPMEVAKPEEEPSTQVRPKEDLDAPDAVPGSTDMKTGVKPPEATVEPPSLSLAKRVTDATTRFISTFRGRIIQGLKVDLPPGYVGLVLRADGAITTNTGGSKEEVGKKGKIKGKGKAKVTYTKPQGRATRSTTRVIDVNEEDADMYVDMDVDMDSGGLRNDEELPDQTTTRTLAPSSQFSSFVLWHPR
jgi:hypothetical protein